MSYSCQGSHYNENRTQFTTFQSSPEVHRWFTDFGGLGETAKSHK